MEADIRKRMTWIRLYQRIGTAGVVCRRCGVSRPTLRKWLRRYEQGGPEALVSRSRRPHTHPGSRIDRQIEAMIVDMRMDRRFGVRRLQCELFRQHNLHHSLASIHKVLVRNELSRLTPRPRWRHETKRYSRPIPGDRVQDWPKTLSIHGGGRLHALSSSWSLSAPTGMPHPTFLRAYGR